MELTQVYLLSTFTCWMYCTIWEHGQPITLYFRIRLRAEFSTIPDPAGQYHISDTALLSQEVCHMSHYGAPPLLYTLPSQSELISHTSFHCILATGPGGILTSIIQNRPDPEKPIAYLEVPWAWARIGAELEVSLNNKNYFLSTLHVPLTVSILPYIKYSEV